MEVSVRKLRIYAICFRLMELEEERQARAVGTRRRLTRADLEATIARLPRRPKPTKIVIHAAPPLKENRAFNKYGKPWPSGSKYIK